VEKLLGIQVTERCAYIRVILSEISRLSDHLTCVGASAMELGAFTVFLYMIKAREFLWEVIEAVTGARLTISHGRVGGLKADLPPDFEAGVRRAFAETRTVLEESHKLLTSNRIFVDRMQGVGILSREEAIAYAVTGPLLRASGVPFDVRRATPYWVYDRLDFEIPVGETGDNYDRYLVRMAEMEQSMRIAEQALAQLPGGPVNVDHEGRPFAVPAEYVDRGKLGKTEGLLITDIRLSPNLAGQERRHHVTVNAPDKRTVLPPKETTYQVDRGHELLHADAWTASGSAAPEKRVLPVRGANGARFYIVSDGTDRPTGCGAGRLPAPMAALHRMLEGGMVADIVPTFGSVNMIGGELDR
jgi:NADH-quinone oxidoreductase subunit D